MRTLPLESTRWPTPTQVYEALDHFVIGQRRAKRTVAIAAYNHLKRITCRNRRGEEQGAPQETLTGKEDRPELLRKSNILLIGPTGCGKTHLARNLARILDLPFTVVDATEYTEAGYYGKDVEVMVAELLYKTDFNVAETQRGIIFIDEIDKIARRSHGARTGAGSRDIGGEGVQQALLKLLEGREVFVPINITQHWNKHDFVQVDTRDILFICGGTFSDIHLYGSAGKPIGFESRDGSGRGSRRRHISLKDLLSYGLLTELLGRLPVVVEMEELTEEELYQVLTLPPDSVVREYRELMALDGIELRFEERALREVVAFAVEKSLGARGLKSIMEEVMHDIMFDAPANRGRSVLVDGTYVRTHLSSIDPKTIDLG